MAAQPEHRENRAPHGRAQISVIDAPRGVDRRALWVLAVSAAAIFSIGAGTIHAATISDQFQQYRLYGITFVAFAIGQIGWGLLAARFPSRPLLVLGLVGNALVFVLWTLTRTVGSFVGPFAHIAMPVGFPDAVATTFEGLAVANCIAGLVVSRRPRQTSRTLAAGVWITAAAIAVPLATLAILSQIGLLPSLPPSY